MNLKDEFNRLAGMFGQGVERAQDAAEDLRDETKAAGCKAQQQFKRGTKRLMSVEETALQTMRERPQLFIVVVVCLLALIVAKVVLAERDARD